MLCQVPRTSPFANGSSRLTDEQYEQAGEKRAQEEDGILLGPTDKGTMNPFAQELLDEMASWEPSFVEQDGWLLFLCGIPLNYRAVKRSDTVSR